MLSGVLDVNKLKHSPESIKKLYTNKKDTVVADEDFYILFPERFINKNLAIMGSYIKVLGVLAVVSKDNKYGIINSPIFITLSVNNVTETTVDGVVYKLLEINKGHTFITNVNQIRSETFLYDIFDEFILQGKVPWYIDYVSLSNLFLEAKYYAGSNLGNDPLAMEIIASIISRSSKDKKIMFRNYVKDNAGEEKPTYIGLKNVFYSYDNTTSKIMGGYAKQGITTAIVNKETRTTKTSELLRK